MMKEAALMGAKTDTEAARAAATMQLKKQSAEMRLANFNLGAHLPEHNKYSIGNLTTPDRGLNFHTTAKGILQNNNNKGSTLVSEGMIGRGLPSF